VKRRAAQAAPLAAPRESCIDASEGCGKRHLALVWPLQRLAHVLPERLELPVEVCTQRAPPGSVELGTESLERGSRSSIPLSQGLELRRRGIPFDALQGRSQRPQLRAKCPNVLRRA
jgi:hypothetical protein